MAVPSRAAYSEALDLSGDILRGIELSESSLTAIALKAARLARLLGDFDAQLGFQAEAGGYSSGSDGLPTSLYKFALRMGRQVSGFTKAGTFSSEMVSVASIEAIEQQVKAAEVTLATSSDADPYTQQLLRNGQVGLTPKAIARKSMADAIQQLSRIRQFIYSYALEKHYELKFSGIADDVFSRVRNRVDAQVGTLVPDAVKRFSAAYDNLQSTNPEDWSNAVHSCRRILHDLADALFPPTDEKRYRTGGDRRREVLLGPTNYINRLIAFVEDNSSSTTLVAVVGSHLSFLGDRLDAVFNAAQKGSHSTIVSRDEADRYVLYVYMVVGDLLSLVAIPSQATAT